MRAAAALFFILLTWLIASQRSISARHPQQAPAPQASPLNEAEREWLLALGKKLFLQRCASCHNERGDKPLSSGPPLAERKLTAEVIVRNVNGRFKNASAEDRQGVTLYIQSFLKQ